MKLGMNMLLWSDDVTDERYGPVFELLAEIGYDGVEIPIFAPAPERYEALGRRLEQLGLERLAVTARGEDENPISADAAVRARAVAANKAVLDSAQALGAPILCGPFGRRSASSPGPGRRPTSGATAWRACGRRPSTPSDAASPSPSST